MRWAVFGVDSAVETVDLADGGSFEVEYPQVTRSARSPLRGRSRCPAPKGFDGPIKLAVSRPWIEIWDENGLYPGPSSETGDHHWVVYEFDPPDGSIFKFFYDARPPTRPCRSASTERSNCATTASRSSLQIDFTTTVRP